MAEGSKSESKRHLEDPEYDSTTKKACLEDESNFNAKVVYSLFDCYKRYHHKRHLCQAAVS